MALVRKCLVAAAASVPVVLGVGVWLYTQRPGTVPPITPDDVEWISLQSEHYWTPPQRVWSDDPQAVASFVAALQNARPGRPHKCSSWGLIRIAKKTGEVEKLYILPGHDPRYYEYCYAGTINRVDRGPFLAALRGLGVKSIQLEPCTSSEADPMP